MPAALPLYHPTAAELHAAHEIYVRHEKLEYVYRVARYMIGGSEFSSSEAIDLLLRTWNAQSPYTWKLTIDSIDKANIIPSFD